MRNTRILPKFFWVAIVVGLFGFMNLAQADTVLPEFVGGVKPETIFKQADAMKIFKKCTASATDPSNYQQCLLDAMQSKGANDQSIAFLKYASGWITEDQAHGNITIVHAFIPAADHDDGYFVISNDGTILDVDDATILNDIDITKNTAYQTIIKNYPSATIWPGNHQGFPDVTTSPQNSPRLIFTYTLLNGCHACEIAGTAKIAFDFDDDGRFLGATLIDLSPVPVSTTPPAASSN